LRSSQELSGSPSFEYFNAVTSLMSVLYYLAN